jgi:glycine cleavage system aminomethyltransferase T
MQHPDCRSLLLASVSPPEHQTLGSDKWMVELEQEQDFIGRDALREVSNRGVTRKLVGVELGGARLGAYNDGSMPDFFAIKQDGEVIGKVTSACYSPRLEKNIGYAMVPIEHSELGTQLVAERPEETVEAVVADRVFFKPEHAEQKLAARPGPAG